jgi:hypothetical protein
MTIRSARTVALAVTLASSLLVLAACGDSKEESATTTTAEPTSTSAPSTTAAASNASTVLFNEQVQADLKAVGCYAGADDGIIGPQTDAAIVAFQTAEGLPADGRYGPATEAALNKAVEENRTVCTGSASTTTSTPASTTTAAGGQAPCTATALLGGLPAEGETITSYVCADGYAAGTLGDGTTKFVLQSRNGSWFALSQDPCGSASAGLPPVILENGC